MYAISTTIGAILLVMAIGMSFIRNEKDKVHPFALVLMGIVGTVFIMLAKEDFIEQHSTIPTALDVYKLKTTLQITYRDSVPIDTVVVFKENR